MIAVALATWSVQDPSLSHATNAPVRNILGTPGAISADLLMQLLGLAAVALLLPVAVWGWRLLTHRPLDRERVPPVLWVAGTLAAAGFASCLPPSQALAAADRARRRHRRRAAARAGLGSARCPAPNWSRPPAVLGLCTLIAVVIATGFGYHDPSEVKLDDRWARQAAGLRTTTKSAPRSRSACSFTLR